MAFFQVRSLAGSVWPPIPVPEASQVWAAYRELDRTQWLTPPELEELQFRQLRALLMHCFHEVPYYRRLLTEAGMGGRPIKSFSDFRKLPILTRELYQTHFAELQARSLPPGMTAAGEAYTSGTNGVPLKVMKTNRVTLWWNAFFLRDLEWSGLDPRGRLAAIRILAMSPEQLPAALEGSTVPFWNKHLDPIIESGPSYGMDIRQDPRRQLQWLKRIHPDYLLSMPTNLELLADLLQESGERIPALKAIQAYAEPLPAVVRQRIESGFGVPVYNVYSATEAGYIASPCPTGGGLHVHSENVIVEVLDADDRPCLPGQTGRLVFTTLHNFLTPFVRYEILDEVTLALEPCRCGRGLPAWTHVEGRRYPSLHLPDGRRKSSMGTVLGIRKVGASRQFQIVQRAPDHVVVRVVPDRTWTAANAEQIRQVVRDELESPISVDVEERAYLDRPSGGKLRLVVVENEGRAVPR